MEDQKNMPESLRLAAALELLAMDMRTPRAAAAELRRLHARVVELEDIERQLCEQADVAADAYRELDAKVAAMKTALVAEEFRTAEQSCANASTQCAELKFEAMPMLKTYPDGVKAVKCFGFHTAVAQKKTHE